jgi:hypothetical protein
MGSGSTVSALGIWIPSLMLVMGWQMFGKFGTVVVQWVGWVILRRSLELLYFSAVNVLVGISLVLISSLMVVL